MRNNKVIEGTRKHIQRVSNYFYPIIAKSKTLDGNFRIGDEIYTVHELSKSKDWTKVEHRIRMATSGLLFEIYLKEKIKRKLLMHIWVRDSKKELRDYPRFNLPSDITTAEDMLKLTKFHNIAFCVLVLSYDVPRYFWTDFYHNIPLNQWDECSRYGSRIDRISVKRKTQNGKFKIMYSDKPLIDKIERMIEVDNEDTSKKRRERVYAKARSNQCA
jgi:hypothetical protein